jgi:hypothetical protein
VDRAIESLAKLLAEPRAFVDGQIITWAAIGQPTPSPGAPA